MNILLVSFNYIKDEAEHDSMLNSILYHIERLLFQSKLNFQFIYTFLTSVDPNIILHIHSLHDILKIIECQNMFWCGLFDNVVQWIAIKRNFFPAIFYFHSCLKMWRYWGLFSFLLAFHTINRFKISMRNSSKSCKAQGSIMSWYLMTWVTL